MYHLRSRDRSGRCWCVARGIPCQPQSSHPPPGCPCPAVFYLLRFRAFARFLVCLSLACHLSCIACLPVPAVAGLRRSRRSERALAVAAGASHEDARPAGEPAVRQKVGARRPHVTPAAAAASLRIKRPAGRAAPTPHVATQKL